MFRRGLTLALTMLASFVLLTGQAFAAGPASGLTKALAPVTQAAAGGGTRTAGFVTSVVTTTTNATTNTTNTTTSVVTMTTTQTTPAVAKGVDPTVADTTGAVQKVETTAQTLATTATSGTTAAASDASTTTVAIVQDVATVTTTLTNPILSTAPSVPTPIITALPNPVGQAPKIPTAFPSVAPPVVQPVGSPVATAPAAPAPRPPAPVARPPATPVAPPSAPAPRRVDSPIPLHPVSISALLQRVDAADSALRDSPTGSLDVASAPARPRQASVPTGPTGPRRIVIGTARRAGIITDPDRARLTGGPNDPEPFPFAPSPFLPVNGWAASAASIAGDGDSVPGSPAALVLLLTFTILISWRRILCQIITLPREITFLVPVPPG